MLKLKTFVKQRQHFVVSALLLMFGGVLSMEVFAASGTTNLGTVASNITSSFTPIVKFITALCYVGGVGFAGAGIMKFKQYKDNPQGMTLGQPVMLIVVAAALVWLPQVIKISGGTVWGTGGTAGSVSGVSSVTGGSSR